MDNLPFPLDITIGQKYEPAMKIDDQKEADEYLEKLVEHTMKVSGRSYMESVTVEKSNLGYFAGYYDEEVRRRVERLFRCSHPVFGAIAASGPPTSEEAFEMGRRAGGMIKEEDGV